MSEAALILGMALQQGLSGTVVFFINIIAVVLIFYFLLIRPQRKSQEKHRKMIAAIGKGDEVVTTGGIIGTVIRAEEDNLVIKTCGETKITIERTQIARKVTQES